VTVTDSAQSGGKKNSISSRTKHILPQVLETVINILHT